jgi:hypothetical protein
VQLVSAVLRGSNGKGMGGHHARPFLAPSIGMRCPIMHPCIWINVSNARKSGTFAQAINHLWRALGADVNVAEAARPRGARGTYENRARLHSPYALAPLFLSPDAGMGYGPSGPTRVQLVGTLPNRIGAFSRARSRDERARSQPCPQRETALKGSA